MLRIACVVLLAGLLAACPKKAEPVVHKATLDDDESAMTLVVGDQLQVTLPEMQFKGYQWRVRYYDPKSFELMRQMTLGEGTMSRTTGGAVKELFLFRANAPGEFTLEIEHFLKPTDPQPDTMYTIDITVTEKQFKREFE